MGHTKQVSAVSVTSEGDKTISGSYDCMIKVWNTDINSRYSKPRIYMHTIRTIVAVYISSNYVLRFISTNCIDNRSSL